MPTNPELKSLSVVVPVGGRYGDARKLYAEYKAGLAGTGIPAEFFFVLDGPRPKFAAELDELLSAGEQFTVISLTRSFGGAAALMAGVERANGDDITAAVDAGTTPLAYAPRASAHSVAAPAGVMAWPNHTESSSSSARSRSAAMASKLSASAPSSRLMG